MDDISLNPAKTISSLYPLMDGRDEIVIKTHMVDHDADGNPWPDGKLHPEVVKAQPGFFIAAAYNPDTPGAVLAEALKSRFKVKMRIPSDYDLALQAGVPSKFVRIAKSMDTARKDGEVGWAPEMRELFDLAHIARVAGDEMALANLAHSAPDEESFAFLVTKIKLIHGTEIKPLALGKQM
jgi:MoxR-like ATPase